MENNFDIINISFSTAEWKKELSRFEQQEGAISARAAKKALSRREVPYTYFFKITFLI